MAALLIRRLVGRGSPLGSVAGLGGMLVAIAVGTAASATVGATSLWLGDVITTDTVRTVWRTWWLGDLSGALVVVPLGLAWWGRLPRRWGSRRALEAALLLAAVAGLCELVSRSHRPLADLVFPALIWAALRFGQRGATLAVAVAAILSVWNTVHYAGPFVFHSITHSVLSTQLFIAVASVSTLYLAAVVSERRRFAAGLAASRARLIDAADTERRRLEHNLHDGAQQRFISVAAHLGLAAEVAQQRSEEDAAVFAELQAELLLGIDELRELGHGIHPAVLTDFGLATAIRNMARRSSVPIELLELPATRVDAAAETTAYYVFAEAVANAQKHAHASKLQVVAVVGTHTLHIEVADDGVGGATESAGSGLQGLRDRVEAVGGTFHVDSATNRGTVVAAAIPLAAAT